MTSRNSSHQYEYVSHSSIRNIKKVAGTSFEFRKVLFPLLCKTRPDRKI